MNLRGITVLACILAVPLNISSKATDDFIDQSKIDCGAYALYHLLRIEGMDVSPRRVLLSLPPPNPEGYSMKELKDSAAALGMELRGANLQHEFGIIDRPMLAFLSLNGRGHYTVIRPVGHTGQLVQVIDDVGQPLVIDSSKLFASPWWTGTVLMKPRITWFVYYITGVFFLSASIFLLAVRFYDHRLRKRKTDVGSGAFLDTSRPKH